MNIEERMAILQRIGQAFSPSSPIDQQSLFAGRIHQLNEVMSAVTQRGQHVILFGERGVGKTSLSRVISRVRIHGQNVIVPEPVNCDATMNFAGLWKKIFREISFTKTFQQIGFSGVSGKTTTSFDEFLPPEPGPEDIRRLLTQLGSSIIIIDELDRLVDEKSTTLLADTVKTLSDHTVPCTLILVGVADSVDMLIREHQSIERALRQVKMPRMSTAELTEIIDKGLVQIGMSIDDGAKMEIAKLSKGLPHYTHLLALNAAQHAAMDDRLKITGQDVRKSIKKALHEAQQSVISSYLKATNSSRDNLYPQVLLACALAKVDAMGTFAATDVREPMCRVMSRAYDIPAFSQHLKAFCEDERGPILQRIGTTRRFRFRFVNPLMQPYILMHGTDAGLLADGTLQK